MSEKYTLKSSANIIHENGTVHQKIEPHTHTKSIVVEKKNIV